MTPASQARDSAFTLTYWGVRGSIPTPGTAQQHYGGNTTCLSVEGTSGEMLIFDGGTGIRPLGLELAARPELPSVIHLFLTHFHWDHIQGLPYFVPLFRSDAQIVLHSALPASELRSVLARQMAPPFFPVDFGKLPSQLEFRQTGTAPMECGNLRVQSFPLCHPQSSQGYRIEGGGRIVVFATDHEHGDPNIDANLREVSRGADVLICDAQYTPAEYESHRGWGHGTWLQAAELAAAAQVRQLVLTHHDPQRDDAALSAIEAHARQVFPNTSAAREGSSWG
jgi:phosphoribosyl 1,2-cyclic phosphodiesterase